ncbi:MAG: SpoIIIAC/SpoIIIAD family protein [bacterium]|nr:SpoIIIAC/SpoIIIAD family protein [bacterium]
MNVIQTAMIAVAGVLLALVLQKERSEYGVLLSIAVGCIIFFSLLGRLQMLLESVNRLKNLSAVDTPIFAMIVKMIGITYVAEFAVNLCKDAGFSAIASQIATFSKLSILLLALPVIEAFLEMIATVAV